MTARKKFDERRGTPNSIIHKKDSARERGVSCNLSCRIGFLDKKVKCKKYLIESLLQVVLEEME